MNKKGTIIFDLDDTLFDTARLKSNIFSLLAESGISFEVIQQSYLELREQLPIYQIDQHVSFLYKKTGTQISQDIIDEIQKVNYAEYVDADVKNMLSELSDEYELQLLSLGQQDVQMKKIFDAGLDKYFSEDKIIITIEPKEKKLTGMIFSEPTYFVNDKVYETEVVAERYPKFKCIVVGEDRKTDLPTIKSVLDVKNIL